MDIGATLAKLALRAPDGDLRFSLLAAAALPEIVARIEAARPGRLGLTGGGAAALARKLERAHLCVDEFTAWGVGAAALQPGGPVRAPHLLVSLGTGTSVLHVDDTGVRRVGGTALGGGTLLGLGRALVGTTRFEELAALAAAGRRGGVDLLVSDIYREGGIALPGELTAASFGKLAQPASGLDAPTREDLAHALMGLVGENVALICSGLAGLSGVRRVVLAGSTLRGNPTLVAILEAVIRLGGKEPALLPNGEFAGALGALHLATR